MKRGLLLFSATLLFFGTFAAVEADTASGPYYPYADGATESANWKTGATACTATNCYDEAADNDNVYINNTSSGSESFLVSTGIPAGSTITSADVLFLAYKTSSCAEESSSARIKPFVLLDGATTYNGATNEILELTETSHSQTITVGGVMSSSFAIGVTYTDGACGIAGAPHPPYALGARKAHAAGEDQVGFVDLVQVSNIVYTPPASSMTISGTVYADKGVTATSSTVKVVVNGTTASSTSAAANGTYSVTMSGASAGTPITVYLDNGGSTKAGTTVTRYSSGNITGLNVYNKTLITRHEDSTALSNANIGVCDKTTGSACADSDLHFDVSGTTLTVDNDWDLFVWSGDTFTPAGDVTLATGGSAANIYVTSSAVMSMGAYNLSVPTPAKFTMTGSGMFTQTTGTTTVQSSGAMAGSNGDKLFFGHYVASSGTHTIQASTSIAKVLTIKSGATFSVYNGDGGSPRLTLSGTGTVVANNGTLTLSNTNTSVQYTGSSATVAPASASIVNLILGSSTASGTYTAGGNLTISTFEIASSTGVNTFNGGTATTSMQVFSVGTNGAFSAVSSTIRFSGSINFTIPALTYWNLTVGGNASAVSSTLAGNITVNNVLSYLYTNQNETFNLGSYTVTLAGSGMPFVNQSPGSHILKTASSTVNYTGRSATTLATTTYWNLGVGTTADASGVTYTAGSGNITVGNQLTIGAAGSSATDILSMGSYTMTLDGAISSGVQTPLAVTQRGAVSTSTGTIKYAKSGAKVAPTSYFNLTVEPTAGTIYIATSTGKTVTVYGTSTFNINAGSSVTVDFNTYDPNFVFYGDVVFSACPEVCGSFQFGSGTFTFSPTGTKTFTNNYSVSTNFGVFILSGGASTPTLSVVNATTLTSFNIASGHTLSSASNLTFTSHFQGAGTATLTAGTLAMNGTAYLGGAGNWTFNSLTISSSTTASSTGNMTVNGILTVSAAGTLYAGSKTWTFASSGTPFVKTGTFYADNSTTTYTASAATNITSATYSNLALNGTATFTAAGAITASSTFTHANGTLDLSASNYALTVSGNYTRTGGAGFNMRGSTITVSGNWTSTVGGDYEGASTTIGTATVVMNGSGTKTIQTGGTSVWLPRFYNLNIAQGIGNTTQLLQTFGVKNITTIGAGTLDLNSKYIYLGNGGSSSNANPLSIDPSATVGTGNGYLLFFGGSMTQYAPGFNYNTNLGIQASNNTTKQIGDITAVGMLVSCCTNRVGTWDTNGYNLTLSGTMTIDNYNATLTLGNSTVTVGTNWNNPNTGTAPGTVNYGTSTVVFTSTATGRTIKAATSTPEFYNVTFNGSGGGWVFVSTTTIAGDLAMTAGTLSGTSTLTVSGGDVTGDGTINLTGGTFNVNGTGSFGGSTAWRFGNLTFGGVTTAVGSGTITATGTLTIDTSDTLNAGGKTWNLLGSGTPFVTTGTFTPATSTILYGATSATNVTAANYYNLQVGSSTATTVYTLGGNTTVGGALTINNSSGINGLAASSHTLTFASSGSVFVINENGASSTAFQSGTGTVNFTGAGTTTIPALTYYHLGAKPSSTNSHQFAAGTIAIGGNFTAGDGTHTGMVDASPNSTTLSVTGSMLVATSGVFKANAANTISIGGNYTNYGTLVHNTGQVTFNGTSQQTLSGNLSGGSAFSRLVFSNNSGTLASPSILLSTSTQTAATSTIVTASTTVRFAAGQTYTLNSLNWNGQATTSRVGLRSSSGGSQWYLNVSGAKSVQNVNVQDSNACGSSSNISVGNDTVDSTANNSCWDWPLPGTPGTPTFPYVSSTWIVVNWAAATDATYYNLYRAPNSGGPYAFIASTTLTSSTNTGLSPGTTYWYEVVGANGTGVGPTSSAASATTLTVSQGYATSASLTSVIYDTAATGGVAPNSITWQGTRPVGTTVKFQIAGSNATTGPWTYTAWNGSGSTDPDVACDASSYYPRTGTSEPNTAVELKAVCQQNKRYLRYKLFLESTSSSTTPTVDDIILNYAR